MTYYHGIIFLTRNSDVQYIDFEGKEVRNINSLRKQELFQLAIDLNLVSPTLDQSQCKAKELKDLVKSKLSDQVSKSKLIIKAARLHHQECGQLKWINAFADTLLIYDITQKHVLVKSATVKLFFVSLSVISVVPFPAESCVPVSLAAYSPENDSCIILMADGRQKDGGLWEIRSSGESKLLVQNGSTICQAVHGICLYDDKVIISDRKRNILVEVDVSNGDLKEFSGKGECKSADECSSFCCFAQPFLVCCEEKALFVTDRATLAV